MSGGPPHHPHNRQVPAANIANTAWNHLQVPNFFPRQPQLAHMSNEHSLLHQPTWHTPTTTEAMKMHPHSHVLSEMFKNEALFPRDCVDLSLTRNGNQNGEVAPIPMSLSVRDTNKINSLPPSALDIQAVELIKATSPSTKPASPGLMSASPSLKVASLGTKSSSSVPKSASPILKSASPGLKSASPVLKSVSPGLSSTTSGLIAAAATTSGLITTLPGMIPNNSGMLPVSSNLISTSRSMLSASQGLASASPALQAGSPVPKSISPGLKPASPGLKPAITQGLPFPPAVEVIKTQKRSNVRVDSILERLNPSTVHVLEHKPEESVSKQPTEKPEEKTEVTEKPVSVIVQPTSSFDDNSNSSSILNVPTSTNVRDEDTVSSYSNEDSLDSNKSRRKRKPNKTIRVSKDEEKLEETGVSAEAFSKESKPAAETEKDPVHIVGQMLEEGKSPEKAESSHDLDELIPAKTRRKASSESETIDNIAAMVQEGLKEKKQQKQQPPAEKPKEEEKLETPAKPISVSVIKTKEHLADVLADTASPITTTTATVVTPAQKKATNTHFVEVENKLEEMFAGIEDFSDPMKSDPLDLDDSKLDDSLLKLVDAEPSTSQKSEAAVTSSTEVKKKSPTPKKTKRKAAATNSRWSSDAESTPKKMVKKVKSKAKARAKKPAKAQQKQQATSKAETAKDVYAYDSGSNTSSTKSKGPFIQIRGNRDSPLSVNVVNTPANEEDGERRLPKTKKFHDDVEYRHKVRSKGLHCSTLSNKYDAQTKDASWICAFCKRGPHASELSGPSSDREIIPPGDLFGPYFITTQCPEFERRLDDPYDKQFKSKKISRALDESAVKSFGKKSKRKHSEIDGQSENELDAYLGITETGNKSYEVWGHEDCIVWSPGIYLIGPKIAGLEEAVWTCCNVTCRSCNLKGANISCLRRGCLNVMHLCCARSDSWQFIDSEFKAYCPEHRVP